RPPRFPPLPAPAPAHAASTKTPGRRPRRRGVGATPGCTRAGCVHRPCVAAGARHPVREVAGVGAPRRRAGDPALHGLPHGLALPLVRRVRVVPGRVQQHHDPGRRAAVDGGEVAGQPPVLLRARVEVGVRAEHDDVDGAAGGVEGVVEAGPRAALLVRHPPPRGVRRERPRPARERHRGLHLVVPFGDHPWPPARVLLHEPAERVPQRLLGVGVGQASPPTAHLAPLTLAACGHGVRPRRHAEVRPRHDAAGGAGREGRHLSDAAAGGHGGAPQRLLQRSRRCSVASRRSRRRHCARSPTPPRPAATREQEG
ncbi:Os04g0410700, partial [Oryza sativa Japonica Group]